MRKRQLHLTVLPPAICLGRHVDFGVGVTAGSLSFELISAAWLPIAGDAREVFDHVVAVYDKTGIQPDQGPSGYIILGVANIAAFARAGEIPL